MKDESNEKKKLADKKAKEKEKQKSKLIKNIPNPAPWEHYGWERGGLNE